MKQMIQRSIMFGALVLLFVATATAQPRREKVQKTPITKEEIAQRQWSKVCRVLTLDDATQAKFEPVYKKYQAEKMALLPETFAVCPVSDPKDKQLSDADAERIINDRLDRAAKLVDINKRYYTEFRKILSPKQILRIFETDCRMCPRTKGKAAQCPRENRGRNR